MEYIIRDAKLSETELLKSYKRHSIYDYANLLSEEEKLRIENYIEVNFDITNYKVIAFDDSIIGAYLVTVKEEVLLDEIYIEEPYRNKGIATSIIKKLIKEYGRLNLWVYKNNRAVLLYESLGFKIKETTNSRYYMTYR